ncbi:MAG: hypothetical protein BWX80_01466 [Candidatus Hydrogenedentes bacterium ADurb.Bin101]|jgi:hypothetical protein|nr:MAG: hypothetical protein BWX80_01466 [Candidatus Hydrogenedentes bacterium ADurb.Bin101]HOC70234.1 type II toxin-antitoxin system VapC family toxin [Candidatus Hydrogenedentota bacterium]
MDKPTLYLETSIPSFLLAEPSRDLVASARQEITRTWWRRDHARFTVFISDTVINEAQQGNRSAAQRRCDFLEPFQILATTSEVDRLAALYAYKHIVPAQKIGDALHLAFASLYRMDFLCTWNLKHIANAFALRRLRVLNEKQGLFTPEICTPEQLLGE